MSVCAEWLLSGRVVKEVDFACFLARRLAL
jgi:hypothetical protein